MANPTKESFLRELARRYGRTRKLEGSQSLFELFEGAVRVYVRYSMVHRDQRTFYGLRQEDIVQLRGHSSFICFLWPAQKEPLLIPFEDYEEVFQTTPHAADGQYKVQVLLGQDSPLMYVARAGRFSVEGRFGWDYLDRIIASDQGTVRQELSHSQVQTLLGSIGALKGYSVWVPPADRPAMDWSIAAPFERAAYLNPSLTAAAPAVEEVDVVWTSRGSDRLAALFEVEHSTPVYSGLLRFNDIHLSLASPRPVYNIVAESTRRSLFARQLNRATFRASGLAELCTFLQYSDVVAWYKRIAAGKAPTA